MVVGILVSACRGASYRSIPVEIICTAKNMFLDSQHSCFAVHTLLHSPFEYCYTSTLPNVTPRCQFSRCCRCHLFPLLRRQIDCNHRWLIVLVFVVTHFCIPIYVYVYVIMKRIICNQQHCCKIYYAKLMAAQLHTSAYGAVCISYEYLYKYIIKIFII